MAANFAKLAFGAISFIAVKPSDAFAVVGSSRS
jgi:hypothetical protein